MRRHTWLAAMFLGAALPALAFAQFQRPAPKEPHAWITLSDGLGFSGGAITGSNGLSQLLRVAATVNVKNDYGFELTGARIQETVPAKHLVSDPVLNSPRADALFLSFVQMNPEGRGGGFPAVASLGAGVAQRPTNDPTKKRLTGAFQLGFEGNLWRPPVSWADGCMGLRLVLLPTSNHRMLYMVALTVGVRAG